MEELLHQYCQSCNSGLLLMSLPTGFGKTYNVIKKMEINLQPYLMNCKNLVAVN
jgi:hypothetical protein